MELGTISQTARPKRVRGKEVEIIGYDSKKCTVRFIGSMQSIRADFNLVIPHSPELKAKWDTLLNKSIENKVQTSSESIPHWAQEIIEHVNENLPVNISGVIWKSNKQTNRRGVAVVGNGLIRINAINVQVEDKRVLIHEIAHHIVHQNSLGNNHCQTFYEVMFTLCDYFGINLDYVATKEAQYMKTSIKAYNRIKNGYRHPILSKAN